ncbi:helix-turn-helix transcriptional regulator [Mycobacterium sp. 1245801.1]|uniref:helix-turn-helix transcriptional regulator n=1 Tax=Mycobacterium sp. 1245801.1 TaxID=1834075 RepID=UPI0007FE352F|nr:helix-turn-helix transcriptional regulator [Mycobacterium sp. 1245801.1]OBJ17362.1 helix-turn-helix transcriptional regulator [Mycobacterium sp. 1245801.1]
MATLDEFSRIVSGVYSAVITPERWDVTMADVGRAFGGSVSAALVVSDGATRIIKHAEIPADAAKSYAEHFARLDHVLSAVQSGPVGVVRPGAELMWPYERCEFATDWARPNGFEDGMFVRLSDSPSATSLALATPRRSERFDTAENVALARHLVPHFEQALRMQLHVSDIAHRGGDLVWASENARQAIVILAPGSRPIYTNPAAERVLRSDDGLRIRKGRLEAATRRADAMLQEGIAAALDSHTQDIWGGSFVCARPSGRRPYIVHVLPIDPRTVSSPRYGRVIVVIIDPERETEPPAMLLRRLYGLTKSEAQIALMVTRAEGLNPIAEELSVSVTTVKTHLRHVFEKTGTHRQAELVRLVLSLAPLYG